MIKNKLRREGGAGVGRRRAKRGIGDVCNSVSNKT